MKKIITMLLVCAFTLSMAGCGKQNVADDVTTIPSGGNIINVFYVEDNKIEKSDTVYQLKQPDSFTASIEEVMTALVAEFDTKMPSYKYMLDEDNNVTLELSLGGNYSKEENLLIMAAVTNTMFQLDEIGSIRITMNNPEGERVASELFLRDTFYFYDYPVEDNYNKTNVEIYVAGGDGASLEKATVVMSVKPNISLEESIVLHLASNGSIPHNTKVNSVSVNAGVCYLDLSADFAENMENVRSDVVVYSVVNSVTSINGIDKVQIFIDGENAGYYRKTVNIESPLIFNNELVEK